VCACISGTGTSEQSSCLTRLLDAQSAGCKMAPVPPSLVLIGYVHACLRNRAASLLDSTSCLAGCRAPPHTHNALCPLICLCMCHSCLVLMSNHTQDVEFMSEYAKAKADGVENAEMPDEPTMLRIQNHLLKKENYLRIVQQPWPSMIPVALRESKLLEVCFFPKAHGVHHRISIFWS